uniref:CSON012581 protein n=1 Tax=Culicoides sonorensis TaxID=179676 RepID=A0A336M5Q1_CULSO
MSRERFDDEPNKGFYKKIKMDELHILNLPNEITIHIFNHLTKTARILLTSVCSAWHDIVKTHFPRDICIYIRGDMNFGTSKPLFTTFLNQTDRDKKRRTFENLVFTFKPSQEDDPQQFLDFIELIGEEIKNLEIKLTKNDCNFYDEDPLREFNYDEFFKNLYKKMPNLQNLEVKREWMVNLRVLRNLNSLRVNGTFDDLQIKTVSDREITKKFTCESVTTRIYHSQFLASLIHLFPDYMTTELYDLNKKIIGANETSMCHFAFKSNFDFCQEEKLNIQDITGLKLTKISTIPPIVKFTNLKHPGVVKLTLGGRCLSNQLNKFFSCFENVESFTVISESCILEDLHFSEICQNWSQLKELFLHGNHNFSVEHLFQRGRSYFTMRNLETLNISLSRSDLINHNDEEYCWPDFPKLKDVFLEGTVLSKLPMSFYHSIPMKSPNVSEFELNTSNKKFPNEYFIPMIRTWGRNLKVFVAYGEGGFTNDQSGSNNLLYSELMENSKNLERLYITDNTNILIIQICRLFKFLPNLKIITLEMYVLRGPTNIREMTRNDYNGMEPYLHNIE